MANYTATFDEDELALIYEGVKHMHKFRDTLELDTETKVFIKATSILEKIKRMNNDVTSSMYVSDNLLED